MISSIAGLILAVDDRWLTFDQYSDARTVIVFFFIHKSLGLGVLLSNIMRLEKYNMSL